MQPLTPAPPSSPTAPLVLGVDAGGTRTRVLVADLDGTIQARAEAGAANPVAHGLAEALRTVGGAISDALRGLDPNAVGFAVLGLAGDHAARQHEEARRAVAAMLHDAGLRCPHAIVGDALVAFAGATPEPDGYLLISGTGSVAVRIQDRRITDTAGGYGWLLGDAGSGFWLGREAARAAVDTLRGRAQAPHLTRLVRIAVLGDPEPATSDAAAAEQLLAALYAAPPLRLAALAPCVTQASREGDAHAAKILDSAARHLDELLGQLGPCSPEEPVVLAGSCLAPDVLGRRTTEHIRAGGATRLLRAEEGAAGAAWLAATHLPDVDAAQLTQMHRTLTGRNKHG